MVIIFYLLIFTVKLLKCFYNIFFREVSIASIVREKSKRININVNERIRAREVRVIGADSSQMGVLPIHKALQLAASLGMDLVEISPMANPPVCKIMDYGKYKYELSKRQSKNKKQQNTAQIKEIKVRPKTDEHDIQVKLNHIRRFIAKKDKVKVTLFFRGREVMLKEMGAEVFKKIISGVADVAVVEQRPKFEGRVMVMLLMPK